MLRNAFVIVIAVGMLFGGFASPANAAKPTPAQANAAIAARQAAVGPVARKHRRHHHHKKPTASVVVPTGKSGLK